MGAWGHGGMPARATDCMQTRFNDPRATTFWCGVGLGVVQKFRRVGSKQDTSGATGGGNRTARLCHMSLGLLAPTQAPSWLLLSFPWVGVLSQLVANGVIEDIFSLCFGYPDAGVLMLGECA